MAISIIGFVPDISNLTFLVRDSSSENRFATIPVPSDPNQETHWLENQEESFFTKWNFIRSKEPVALEEDQLRALLTNVWESYSNHPESKKIRTRILQESMTDQNFREIHLSMIELINELLHAHHPSKSKERL